MDFIALDLYWCHLGLNSTFRFACIGECEIVDIFLFIRLNNVSAAQKHHLN